MSVCLKFGKLELDGYQLRDALMHYELLATLLEKLFLNYEVLPSISVTSSEVFGRLTDSDGSQCPEDAAEFEQFLIEQAELRETSKDNLLTQVLRDVRLKKLRQQFEPHVESEFLQTKSNFDQVEFSLVQTSDPDLAQELLFQLRDDQAEFGAVAAQHSEGAEQRSQGWVGPIKVAALPDSLARELRVNQKGIVCGPIPVGTQYCVVRLERFYDAHLSESLRSEILSAMVERWLTNQVQSAISNNLLVFPSRSPEV